MTPLVDLAVRSSILLAAGLFISTCLKKRSAALRHRVLATSLVAGALVIPLSFVLPEWTVSLPGPAVEERKPIVTTAVGAQVETSTVLEPQSRVRTTMSTIVLVWVAGVLLGVGTLLSGIVRVSRIGARAPRAIDVRWLEILDSVARRYTLTRKVTISLTDSSDLLATWGILRPHVLLPRHARNWPLDRLHIVLCHELAHIRRHDWLVQLIAEMARALLWFNPLAWIACTRLRRESEHACDDEVLNLGVGAQDYAAHLIELARQCRRPGSRWASALPMAHPSTLERRIAAMLNPRIDRRSPSRRVLAALGVTLLFVALPVSALRARQAGPAPLTGTIYDVTGGVMPGVEVTLLDAEQIIQLVTTNASGRFEFVPIAAGTYVLEVKLPGFRTLRQELALRNGRDWDRAVTLQVGELQETIMVRGTRATLPKQLKSYGEGSESVRIGGNVRPPRKIKDVKPVYPAAMREAGLSGTVPIQAIIDGEGTVSSVRVLSAQVHPDFAIAAVDAVRQWRFTPTLLNGAPVEVVMTVSVRFDLDD